MNDRIQNAIKFLQDGLPFRIDDLYFGIDADHYLKVSGISQSIDLKNITKRTALQELQEIKSMFKKMLANSNDLRNFIVGKQLKFNLDFDYGMGNIRICYELNSVVTWLTKIGE